MGNSCFGTYDIRGRYPEQINDKLAYSIGRIFPALINGDKVAVGRDVRLSGQPLQEALVKGLLDSGVQVTDLGVVGTEEIYFAVPHLGLDGGIMITVSHNPKEYNGVKFVGRDSAPLSNGFLGELEKRVTKEDYSYRRSTGSIRKMSILSAYVDAILSCVDVISMKPYKVVVNAGSGVAGHVLDAMEKFLPFQFVKIGCQPDGNFPKGVPNPLLLDNQTAMAEEVKVQQADFGVAWDGDFDRCFIYDDQGRFMNSCYITGYLAQRFLSKEKGAKIIYDSRAVYNVENVIKNNGGRPVISKSGHVFFKRKMRETNAIYGGEMSGHHYFRDFNYCDSGMLPWLMMAEILSKSSNRMSQLHNERRKLFPVSGEINFKVDDIFSVLAVVEDIFKRTGTISKEDGVSVDFGNCRFNLRASNTESLLRLNVESCEDRRLCQMMVRRITEAIQTESNKWLKRPLLS